MSARSQRRREATAVHEAAHAVAADYGGIRVKIASIAPDAEEGTDGHVAIGLRLAGVLDAPDFWTRRRRLEPWIVALYAGVIADELL